MASAHCVDLESLKICHINSQSIFAHIDEFRLFFKNRHFHIICVSETWLKPGVPDEMVKLGGYALIRADKVGKPGG